LGDEGATVNGRALAIAAVAALLAAAVIRYPQGGAQESVAWPAARIYLNEKMTAKGFHLRCQRRPTQDLACELVYAPAGSTRERRAYACNEEEELRREAVLRRFAAAEPNAELGVLDGFFQSGLRRECDRVVRTSDPITEEIPPFSWDAGSGEVTIAVEPRLRLGLPARPAFRGDVVADASPAVANPRRAAQQVARLRLAGNQSGIELDPRATDTCETWPGGSSCNQASVVTVHSCERSRGPECASTDVEARALSGGRTLLGGGRGPAAPLVHGPFRLGMDELVLVGPEATTVPLPVTRPSRGTVSSLLEISSESRAVVSRVRLVNGRWERWYANDLRPWLEPLAQAYDKAARGEPQLGERPVELALNLDLQRNLEAYLETWMRQVEPDSVAHLASSHQNGALQARPREAGHRRAVPQAAISVLRAADGAVLAVASYPPATALDREGAAPAFAEGWRTRLAGAHPSPQLERSILHALADRVVDEANANFVRHPIGSTFKPLLLSLMIDQRPDDSLARLFDLQVTGHAGNGELGFPPPVGIACDVPGVQAIAGHALGPWGDEEGTVHGGAFVDRAEFLIASCNKYAVTLGVLSLLDWSRQDNPVANCWSPARDAFGFTARQELDGSTAPPIGLAAPPAWDGRVESALELPAPPAGVDLLDANSVRLADQPVFRRLQHYYGVSPRSTPHRFDPGPWRDCPGLASWAQQAGEDLGRVETTQLQLTSLPVGTTYTNLFTGANRNWWTDLKLAEAYARLATNRQVAATFCRTAAPAPLAPLFLENPPVRHRELVQILSRQRLASWVRVGGISAWVDADPLRRTLLSKTGTTARDKGEESTGVFAMFVGEVRAHTVRRLGPVGALVPSAVGDGFVVVAHVDDLGAGEVAPGRQQPTPASTQVSTLVDGAFEFLQRGLE
jgi:hypothetical protein